jgi:hypothetical protein
LGFLLFKLKRRNNDSPFGEGPKGGFGGTGKGEKTTAILACVNFGSYYFRPEAGASSFYRFNP